MAASKGKIWLLAVFLLVLGAGLVYLADWSFGEYDAVRDLFAGDMSSPALGSVAPNDPSAMAAKQLLAGRISAGIYAAIVFLQFAAFVTAFCVIRSIRDNGLGAELQLKALENADIFFDVPLYIGLFGTVSSFLVMSFSPLSSRLIAYSSTLVGIIFSVILRVALLYPLRSRLLLSKPASAASRK